MRSHIAAPHSHPKVEEHNSFYEDGGEFLPLSVWQARGFDIERIRKFTAPQDRRYSDLLGDEYRVRILKTGKAGKEGTSLTSVAHKRKACPQSAMSSTDVLFSSQAQSSNVGGEGSGALSINQKVDSSSAESSSSRSEESTSSSSSHAKKKNKNAKKGNNDCHACLATHHVLHGLL